MAKELKISEKTVITTSYAKTDNIIEDIRTIIQSARSGAYDALNAVIIRKNWLIGKRIVEEEQQGSDRAEYGAHIISELSKNLTSDLGSGYSARNLRNYRSFYRSFSEDEIWQTHLPNLTWSHYNALLRVNDKKAREKGEGDNPTLGIVLCADTDADIAKYSILNGNEQLFASKYKLCLPSDEELRQEIEVQKSIFLQQQNDRLQEAGDEDE